MAENVDLRQIILVTMIYTELFIYLPRENLNNITKMSATLYTSVFVSSVSYFTIMMTNCSKTKNYRMKIQYYCLQVIQHNASVIRKCYFADGHISAVGNSSKSRS